MSAQDPNLAARKEIATIMNPQLSRTANRPSTLPRFLILLLAVVMLTCVIAGVAYQRAAAQAPNTTFTISGTVTGPNGPFAGVTMILLSDVAGTQVALTDQNGNYVLTYEGGVSHSLRITPSKSGFVFNPLAVTFLSSSPLIGNRTWSFSGEPIPIVIPFHMPILLTHENSLRSLALDSVTLLTEPFGVANSINFSTDQRTRISLFAVNVELDVGDTLSIIEAQAEDSLGQVVPLTVEGFRAVPSLDWLKQIVVKLPDQIANSGEVRVSLKVRGMAGNKVTLKVKP